MAQKHIDEEEGFVLLTQTKTGKAAGKIPTTIPTSVVAMVRNGALTTRSLKAGLSSSISINIVLLKSLKEGLLKLKIEAAAMSAAAMETWTIVRVMEMAMTKKCHTLSKVPWI